MLTDPFLEANVAAVRVMLARLLAATSTLSPDKVAWLNAFEIGSRNEVAAAVRSLIEREPEAASPLRSGAESAVRNVLIMARHFADVPSDGSQGSPGAPEPLRLVPPG